MDPDKLGYKCTSRLCPDISACAVSRRTLCAVSTNENPHADPQGKEKKRTDYAFLRHLNEKPSTIPGCPGGDLQGRCHCVPSVLMYACFVMQPCDPTLPNCQIVTAVLGDDSRLPYMPKRVADAVSQHNLKSRAGASPYELPYKSLCQQTSPMAIATRGSCMPRR